MKKLEAKSGTLFRHWIMENPQRTGSYEIKDTRGKSSFNLNEWKPAQEIFAEAIRYGKKGVLIRTEGVEGLPDYVYLKDEPSFVVIKYPKHLIIIDGATLSLFKKKKKTLTLGEACNISYISIPLVSGKKRLKN